MPCACCLTGRCQCGQAGGDVQTRHACATCGVDCGCAASGCSCGPHEIKLYYFNLRGLGEVARLLLSAANAPFEDNRLDSAGVNALKESGKLAYSQVPLLEYDGERIVQSQAIFRFIARQFGFYGNNSIEGAQIDQVVEGFNDIRAKFLPVRNASGEDQVELRANFERDVLSVWLGHLDRLLKKNQHGKSFFVGAKLSLADVFAFNTLEVLSTQFPSMWTYCPAMHQLCNRVAEYPGIKEWLTTRPTA